jgi:hypothetical protein
MYYWLSAYSLVKFRYVSGRRTFEISNEYIGRKENERDVKHI